MMKINEITQLLDLYMVIEEISWWGYAMLCKNLENDKDWKKLLHEIMNKKEYLDTENKSIDWLNKMHHHWQNSVILPSINKINKLPMRGIKTINSNTTRSRIKDIFSMRLAEIKENEEVI